MYFYFLEEGTYIPLLNDPTLMTNEFLAKLERATSTSKIISKPEKQSNNSSNEERKRRRSLKSLAIAVTFIIKHSH